MFLLPKQDLQGYNRKTVISLNLLHLKRARKEGGSTNPNIMAFQNNILLSLGDPVTPSGGSLCNRLKSLINLLLAGVVIFPKKNK